MNRKIFGRRNAGMATLTVLGLLTVTTGLLMVVTSRSMFEMRMAGKSRDKQTALAIAEAGVDDTVERLRANWDYAGGNGSLQDNANGKNVGSFATTITAVNSATRKVISRGTNPNGTSQAVVVLVRKDGYFLGDAAIKANKNVDIRGTADVVTRPINQHVADVYANGDVDMGGNSTVDGTLFAQGSVDAPSHTTGRVYAPSVSGAPPIIFPTDAEVAAMKSQLIAEAQSQNRNYGNITNSVTITAPAYINGNIDIKSKAVVNIVGRGSVFVTGDIRMTGQAVLTNGSTLSVGGTFSQAGGSLYKVTPDPIETPTLVAFNTHRASPAVSLLGGSDTDNQGVFYAVSGGIKLGGNSTFVGALVAGGSDGEVVAHGNYRHIYPENLHSRIQFPGEARVIFWGETK